MHEKARWCRAWLLHLHRLPANVVLCRRSVLPDLIHAPLALFPCIRRGRVCGVEFADDGAAAVSCSGLACQGEVRRAVLIGKIGRASCRERVEGSVTAK